MDEFQLRNIAGRGLSHAVECQELATWLTERGETLPDPRLMALGSALQEVATVWGDDNVGALSGTTFDAVNRALANTIPAALDTEMETGMAIVRNFRTEVENALAEWRDERHQ